MGNVYLLDCTLRDGGYINEWMFGHEAMCDITKKIVSANIDVIECGYYSQSRIRSSDYSIFNSFEDLKKIIPSGTFKNIFAVMINFGECNLEKIPTAESDAPVIRVCFHKKDKIGALTFCEGLIEKGYKVFIQPMAVMNYSDVEFLQMIQEVNSLKPACFYIVDSFGVMELHDFQRLLFIADNNLERNILLGYHSHNNLQQAYGNAKFMTEQNLLHDIIIDASVFGMGRGAGNLNMELFASYLNREFNKNYIIEPLLEIIDEYLNPIFIRSYWGYSLPFYLSAKHNCHPNYAGYFSEKNTLSNKSLNELLASLSDEDKARYSEQKAETYYQNFQRNLVDDHESLELLSSLIDGKNVLILAPGKTLATHSSEIQDYIRDNDPIIIGINTLSPDFSYDFLMCVNEKRYGKLFEPDDIHLLLTSNLSDTDEKGIVFNYSSYLAESHYVADNAVLMLLKILYQIGIKEVSIAGFDGYVAIAEDNYFQAGISLGSSIDAKLRKNDAIKNEIRNIQKLQRINFLTPSIYLIPDAESVVK